MPDGSFGEQFSLRLEQDETPEMVARLISGQDLFSTWTSQDLIQLKKDLGVGNYEGVTEKHKADLRKEIDTRRREEAEENREDRDSLYR